MELLEISIVVNTMPKPITDSPARQDTDKLLTMPVHRAMLEPCRRFIPYTYSHSQVMIPYYLADPVYSWIWQTPHSCCTDREAPVWTLQTGVFWLKKQTRNSPRNKPLKSERISISRSLFPDDYHRETECSSLKATHKYKHPAISTRSIQGGNERISFNNTHRSALKFRIKSQSSFPSPIMATHKELV